MTLNKNSFIDIIFPSLFFKPSLTMKFENFGSSIIVVIFVYFTKVSNINKR